MQIFIIAFYLFIFCVYILNYIDIISQAVVYLTIRPLKAKRGVVLEISQKVELIGFL